MTQETVTIPGMVRMLDKTLTYEAPENAYVAATRFVEETIKHRDFPYAMKADSYNQNIGWPRDDVRQALSQANPDNKKLASNMDAVIHDIALKAAAKLGKKEAFQEAWSHIQSIMKRR